MPRIRLHLIAALLIAIGGTTAALAQAPQTTNVRVDAVEVEASADFAGVGLAAANITYKARVSSPAAADVVARLLRDTDAVAEVHNTIRCGVPVLRVD